MASFALARFFFLFIFCHRYAAYIYFTQIKLIFHDSVRIFATINHFSHSQHGGFYSAKNILYEWFIGRNMCLRVCGMRSCSPITNDDLSILFIRES